MAEITPELKSIGVRLIVLVIAMPFFGYLFLRVLEISEKVWKSNNRWKRWGVMCVIFFIVAAIGGWLH